MSKLAPVARSPIAPVPPVIMQHGWEVSACHSDANLRILDCTPLAKILVQASADGAVARALYGSRLITTGSREVERSLSLSSRLPKRAQRSASRLPTPEAASRPFHPDSLSAVPFGRAARDERGTLVVGSGPGEWLLLAPPGAAPEIAGRIEAVFDEGLVSVVDVTHGRALMRISGAGTPDLLAKVCAIDFSEEVTPDGAAFRSSVAKLVTDIVRDDEGEVRSYLLHCERSSGQYLFDALLDAGDEFGIEVDGFAAEQGVHP